MGRTQQPSANSLGQSYWASITVDRHNRTTSATLAFISRGSVLSPRYKLAQINLACERSKS